jgi:hypothetical protein
VRKSYYFSASRKPITIGREGGINTPRSGTTMALFENPEPPGNIPEPLGTGELQQTVWEQLETSRKILTGS